MSFGSYRWWGCIALVLLLLFSVAGCSGNDTSEFRTFAVGEDPASFSFEYPAFYAEPIIDRTHESDYTLVKSAGSTHHVDKGVESLYIFVLPISDLFPNSLAMLDYELEERFEELDDFRMLERTPITVSGSRGELIVFSYSGHALETIDIYLGQAATAYIAYFDGEGFIWKVDLTADEYAVKQAKIHFEHILQTFKILD